MNSVWYAPVLDMTSKTIPKGTQVCSDLDWAVKLHMEQPGWKMTGITELTLGLADIDDVRIYHKQQFTTAVLVNDYDKETRQCVTSV